jgi:hypothetical protein
MYYFADPSLKMCHERHNKLSADTSILLFFSILLFGKTMCWKEETLSLYLLCSLNHSFQLPNVAVYIIQASLAATRSPFLNVQKWQKSQWFQEYNWSASGRTNDCGSRKQPTRQDHGNLRKHPQRKIKMQKLNSEITIKLLSPGNIWLGTFIRGTSLCDGINTS